VAARDVPAAVYENEKKLGSISHLVPTLQAGHITNTINRFGDQMGSRILFNFADAQNCRVLQFIGGLFAI